MGRARVSQCFGGWYQMTYHHVERCITRSLIADGLTVETLLPGSDNSVLAGSSVTVMHPDLSVRNWEAHDVVPLVVIGPQLDTIR